MMTAIYAWCEKHGIDIDYADTIRQRYYRIREQYAKKGIDLMKKKKSKKKHCKGQKNWRNSLPQDTPKNSGKYSCKRERRKANTIVYHKTN